ncbi:unnamed protein product [Diamesa hyperborea]
MKLFNLLVLLSGLMFLEEIVSGKSSELECVKKYFSNFKEKFNKTYCSVEAEEEALKNLMKNKAFIDENNVKKEVGFKMDLNDFSDISIEEINLKMNGYKSTTADVCDLFTLEDSIGVNARAEIPESKSYKEILSPVRNQGTQCGACWSFATVSLLESYYFIKYKKSISLSEQLLIDCVQNGCTDGDFTYALDYVKANGISNTNYKYTGKTGTCPLIKPKSLFKVKSAVSIPEGNEIKMKEVLANIGPVAVAVDSRWPTFILYKSGVYYDNRCSTDAVNHAMIVVGYGNENNQDYWLVRNSWGDTWGEDGYIKIARNKKSHCGIADYGMYPKLV